MNSLSRLKMEIKQQSDSGRAMAQRRFFKTGAGQYGEGDIFAGLTVPQSRVLAKRYSFLLFPDVKKLLLSPVHEERLIALLILAHRFSESAAEERRQIYLFYLDNAARVNNWDLVDLSADKIVGAYLMERPDLERGKALRKLALSGNLWERRIAIVATFWFIKHRRFAETLKMSELLLSDRHDLIHKAVGWMLREVGKRSEQELKKFLRANYRNLPRTALRYAIERFPEPVRKKFLRGEI